MSGSMSRTRLKQRHAVHAGHADVGDEHPVEALCDEIERRLGAAEITTLEETGELERLGGRAAQFLLVVDRAAPAAGFIPPPRAATARPDIEGDA
jgi:hypothetical protein